MLHRLITPERGPPNQTVFRHPAGRAYSRRGHVPLRRAGPGLRRPARRGIPRPDAPLPRGRADRGRVPAAAAAQRPVHPAPCADAAHRHSLRPAGHDAAAQAGRHRAPLRPRLRPLHHAPEPAAQLAEAGARAGHPGRARHGADALPSRPAATACATSPPTTSPASRPTRSTIRARTARSCASGRRCTRSSPTCRASSRSPSPARREDRAASEVHDIGLQLRRGADGGIGFTVRRRRRPRPHADDRPGDPRVPAAAGSARLPRGDPARLQPLRPARQHPQGAHQGAGEITRRRRASATEVEAEWHAGRAAAPRPGGGGSRARARLLPPAAVRAAARTST